MTACVTGRAKEPLGIALELAQDVRRNLRRRKAEFAKLNARNFAGFDIVGEAEGENFEFAVNLFKAAAHEPLDGVDDALRASR